MFLLFAVYKPAHFKVILFCQCDLDAWLLLLMASNVSMIMLTNSSQDHVCVNTCCADNPAAHGPQGMNARTEIISLLKITIISSIRDKLTNFS